MLDGHHCLKLLLKQLQHSAGQSLSEEGLQTESAAKKLRQIQKVLSRKATVTATT